MPINLVLALPYVIYNNKYYYWKSIVRLSYIYYIINLKTKELTPISDCFLSKFFILIYVLLKFFMNINEYHGYQKLLDIGGSRKKFSNNINKNLVKKKLKNKFSYKIYFILYTLFKFRIKSYV